jgi:glutamate racemase
VNRPVESKITLNQELATDNMIGIFDSGIGGLSVTADILKMMPFEEISYIADTKYIPYGTKATDELIERSLKISDFFIRQQCKAIVVACNTATSAAIEILRQTFDVPIVGIEPAVKPAAGKTKNGIIGVLATENTLSGGKLLALRERHAKDVEVIYRACPGLVEAIEDGIDNEITIEKIITPHISFLKENRADTIVLGCTHYPLVKSLIERVSGKEIVVIDPSPAVATEVKRQLNLKNLLRSSGAASHVFAQTGNNDYFQQIISSRLGLETVPIRIEV